MDEQHCKDLLKQIINQFDMEVYSTKHYETAQACFRVIDTNFCLSSSRDGKMYFIRHYLNPDILNRLHTDIGSKSWESYLYDLADALNKKAVEARLKCVAISTYFWNLDMDSETKLQHKIELEERFRGY